MFGACLRANITIIIIMPLAFTFLAQRQRSELVVVVPMRRFKHTQHNVDVSFRKISKRDADYEEGILSIASVVYVRAYG